MSAEPLSRLRPRREVVRGASEEVIRVLDPVPGLFREAVFFLREEELRRGEQSRETLLRQARQAAEDYVRPLHGKEEKQKPKRILFLLTALGGFLLGLLLGALLFA